MAGLNLMIERVTFLNASNATAKNGGIGQGYSWIVGISCLSLDSLDLPLFQSPSFSSSRNACMRLTIQSGQLREASEHHESHSM